MKRLVVDPASKTVTLHLSQAPTPRQAVLTNAAEFQSGKPVYAFSLPPLPGDENVTNVFKLFNTGREWRLIDAGLLEVNGTFTLRALGKSVVMRCTEGGT